MRWTVLIPQDIPEEGKDYLAAHGCRVKLGSATDAATIAAEAADCDAILARSARFPAIVFETAPRLQVVGRFGVGIDNIDVAAAERHGVWVTVAGSANAVSVAEMTIGLIVALARRLIRNDREFRRGNFEIRNTFDSVDLGGKLLGIVGLGKIGRAVATKARLGLGMRILAHSPSLPADAIPDGVTMTDRVADIYEQADFVSLHRPYRGRIEVGAAELAAMKPRAFFLNLARGEMVDEAALIDALASGRIAGAALDVFAKEPPDPDNPLLTMDNVIVTPHVAALTRECGVRMALEAARGIVDALEGRVPPWPVNRPDPARNGAR